MTFIRPLFSQNKCVKDVSEGPYYASGLLCCKIKFVQISSCSKLLPNIYEILSFDACIFYHVLWLIPVKNFHVSKSSKLVPENYGNHVLVTLQPREIIQLSLWNQLNFRKFIEQKILKWFHSRSRSSFQLTSSRDYC